MPKLSPMELTPAHRDLLCEVRQYGRVLMEAENSVAALELIEAGYLAASHGEGGVSLVAHSHPPASADQLLRGAY